MAPAKPLMNRMGLLLPNGESPLRLIMIQAMTSEIEARKKTISWAGSRSSDFTPICIRAKKDMAINI